MAELGGDFVAEEPACASGTDGPCLDVFGIRPDEIAKGALVGDLLCAGDDADLIQGPDFRAQSAVDAKDFAVDYGTKGHEIEYLTARFPDGSVAVLLHAFLVEAVDLRDLAGFVVTTDEGDAVGVFGFEAEEER